MTETVLRLPEVGERASWLKVHEAIDGHDRTAPLVLELAADIPEQGLSDFGLRMQAILTWGQLANRPVLRFVDYVHGDGETAFDEASDFHLAAASLAHEILDKNANDVTTELKALLRVALAGKRELPPLSPAELERERHSILLASHMPRQSHSLDLHTRKDRTWYLEEEARSLYHNIWEPPGPAANLREPWMDQDEQAIPESSPTHISRIAWPLGHPLADSDVPFSPLAWRTLSPTGHALQLAVQTRVQERHITDEVGEVLFELIQNTEWHGLPPQSGNGRGCRVVSFNVLRITKSDLIALPETDSYFALYADAVLSTLDTDESSDTALLLGVATIIDSGLGLARSAAAALDEDDLFAADTEVGYLVKALGKSVRVSRRAMGNIGLPRVQQLLSNLRGFMSIRTGRTEIHRDFVRHPFEERGASDTRTRPSSFVDWVPETFEDFVVGPRVGTDVTIAFPIAYERDGVRL